MLEITPYEYGISYLGFGGAGGVSAYRHYTGADICRVFARAKDGAAIDNLVDSFGRRSYV
jgi:hypothetical protein